MKKLFFVLLLLVSFYSYSKTINCRYYKVVDLTNGGETLSKSFKSQGQYRKVEKIEQTEMLGPCPSAVLIGKTVYYLAIKDSVSRSGKTKTTCLYTNPNFVSSEGGKIFDRYICEF
jgi:hypothetical protein